MRSLTLTLLPLLLFLRTRVRASTITADKAVVAGKTFDYVVAGAGLSGIVVGTKLAEEGYSVLLIEAGKDLQNNSAIYNAELRGTLLDNPETSCNWRYQASAEDGSPLPILVDSGKCVGGSTSINGMVWYRPTKAELNAIEDLGNPGWNASTLYPYMEAIEHNHPPDDSQRADGANLVGSVHGFHGPVNVSFPTPMRIPTAQMLYKAAVTLVFGIPTGKDLSKREGSVSASTSWTIWWDPIAQITRRASAAYSLLYPPAKQQAQKKLTILVEHTVGKVLFDDDLRATGLEFGSVDGAELCSVYAKKEVILAAGSLATPPILERSGVGSKSVLESFGITPLVDLPGVGLNLQDQPGTGLSALLQSDNASSSLLVDNRNLFAPVISLLNIDELFGQKKSAHYIAKLNQQIEKRAKAAVASGAEANLDGAKELFGTITKLVTEKKQAIVELVGESYPAVMTSIFWPLTPFSRGHIHINSSSPLAPPRITPRFLSDDFDVDVAVQISKRARSLYETTPFAPIIAQLVVDAVGANATDAEWAEWFKSTSFGASHWIGSASMRPRASGGVVSPDLRVYGTKRLRVVDASIIPFQVSSHTMSLAYAVSQKAADIILAAQEK
ncbi:Alcohol oxidase [Mycena kentingensis (nom. inval.)]|nr:Alcohol oxidase [Mycena kentingensis (nom. inval.)]